MSPTIVDLARKMGVSPSTISRALNGKKGVSERSRLRVIKEAEKIGYQPNSIARGLVRKRTETIGLIIPDITNPFFPEVARGIEKACRKFGYNVILCNSNWNEAQERACLESLIQNKVDGLIIEPCSMKNIGYIEESGIHAVYLNSKIDSGINNFISLDNAKAARMATEYLIQCGYKQIAFAGGKRQTYYNRGRLKGYTDVLAEHGISMTSNLIINGRFDIASGYEAAKRLLTLDDPPDAILAANDIIALGVMQYAQENQVKIPETLGIIGFDDIYTSNLPQIQLTTVSIPKALMGEKAFKLLMNNLHKRESVVEDLIVHPKLIVRKTTCARQII